MSYSHISCKGLDEMKHKDFRNLLACESAVSEIIGFILLLAIGVATIALIQTLSVPEWNKEVEIDHSNTVYDDFLTLKSNIEDTALFQFPRSSVIHMGIHYPNRLIFINPTDTSGTITSDRNAWINISYNNSNGTPSYISNLSSSITFRPNYNYLMNSPFLIYENGLVIKDFGIINFTDNIQPFFMKNAINIIIFDYPSYSESSSTIKGINPYPQYKNIMTNNTNVSVNFSTNYPDIWNDFLISDGFNSSGNIINKSGNTIKITYNATANVTINIYGINISQVSGIGAPKSV